MKGDSISVEPHHRRAAECIMNLILGDIRSASRRYAITVGGESGSGKSEVARALSDALGAGGVPCIILQQDDYYVYPPRTNDAERRRDIAWVGVNEVRLDVIDANIGDFLGGGDAIEKPLVTYAEDRIDSEVLDASGALVVIAEGTYTTALKRADTRIFLSRDYLETRAHREKRARHASELDEFTERVLAIEHGIISAHRAMAQIVVASDYKTCSRAS